MIRMTAIQTAPQRPKRFGPFTSVVSAAAMAGVWLGMISLIIDKV